MGEPLPSLLLFARSPRVGQVKTRLVPPLTPEEAARLYLAFLEDAARTYLAPGAWIPVLAADPDPDDPTLAGLFGPPWRRQKQALGDLGERLAFAFDAEFSRGAAGVVAIGSDHPALPQRLLQQVVEGLREGDAAIIPAEDGGYCAVGLRSPSCLREVFREIPWSTPSVLAVTQKRMRAAGLRVTILESAYDVDRPEDLGRLRRDLASRDPFGPDFPEATARALAALPEAVR